MEPSLAGRTFVVTGVSRRRGIGYAVAARLADLGAGLFLHHYAPHDADQPWGADSVDDVVASLRGRLRDGAPLADASIDLAQHDGAERLVVEARSALGHLDGLVCNHARSGGDGRLDEISWKDLDAHWQVNTRSTILATKHFAEQHDGREGGRVIWMTSGQVAGPMTGEIAYAASKAALAGLTASVADHLVDRRILLNTVNPGPVNTGYLDDATADRRLETLQDVLAHCPSGRFGEPDDPARLITWLLGDEGRWMVGQVLSTEGGFRRW
ncbi:SDR family oxidoreductase [Arthrobacter ruber]|uniref:SDR family oxidoreductase n=1 Tax=Arthrobacter ruber TaxID=1258893 RepID=UPI000CF53998|nr:SDR family oxidoreductase [Arthrobacter ruber]